MSEKPSITKIRKNYSSDFKLNVINRSKELSSIKTAADEFGITPNTVRQWIKNYELNGVDGLVAKSSRPHHSPKKTSQWIIDKILKIKKGHPEMGAQAMSEHLKRFESVNLSSTAVGKVFKKEGLCDGDAGYAESSYLVKGDKDKNLEKTLEAELGEWERFARPNPNDLWQMDIMSFYIRDQHKVYLISVLDDCSRFIVNWGLFKEQTADNVLEVLRGALAKHGVPVEILTDQGAQFKHGVKRYLVALFFRFPNWSDYQYHKHVRFSPETSYYVSLPTIRKLKKMHEEKSLAEKERIKKRWCFAKGTDVWTVDYACIIKTTNYKLQLLTVSV